MNLLSPLPRSRNRTGSYSNCVIQNKLKQGKPGDKYEKEADSISDKVMGMSPSDTMQMQPIGDEEELLQPKLLMAPEKVAMDTNIQMQTKEEEENKQNDAG